jgi:glycosyltransferase involved in cell wall biosynthesis
MKLVVMIPAYNEEETIGEVIRGIPRDMDAEVQVLVIDDGSTDNTRSVAMGAGADKVVSHRDNNGVGVAFRTGIEAALDMGADIIVNIDADGQFDPADIPRLIKPIVGNEVDMVTGSRFLDRNLEQEIPRIKRFGNRVFTGLINRLTGNNFTDTQCGFRAYSKEAALRLNLFGDFTYTQEVFIDLVTKGMKIGEVPLQARYKGIRRSRVASSIPAYTWRALFIIIRTIRDSRPLAFFGTIGFVSFFTGGVLELVLLIRLLLIHRIYPFMALVWVGLVFIILGFLLIILALIADLIGRQIRTQEEVLYLHKRERYGRGNHPKPGAGPA